MMRNNLKFDQICRTCLSDQHCFKIELFPINEKLDLMNTTIIDMIMACASVHVCKNFVLLFI